MTTTIEELTNTQLIEVAPAIAATKPYGDVSERYSFVPTITAINILRDSGWIPVMAGQAGVRLKDKAGYQKHLVRFTRPDLVVNGHRMDLCLYNSHDRGCAFQLIGGVFRFVCANGMIVGDRVAEYSHKHIGFSPEILSDYSLKVGQHIEKTAGVIEDWQAIDMEEIEQNIFARAAHQLIYDEPKKAPVQPHQLLSIRRTKDREKNDLWTTFNTVQGKYNQRWFTRSQS